MSFFYQQSFEINIYPIIFESVTFCVIIDLQLFNYVCSKSQLIIYN